MTTCVTSKINVEGDDWLRAANILYKNEKVLRTHYRRKIDQERILIDKEQEWADLYLQELADMITSEDIWKCMVPHAEMYGVGGKRSARRINPSLKCQVHYSGSHWRSRKGGNCKAWFDSHNEYQPRGTNQFCGIFAMMYLLDRLPEKSKCRTFERYYYYTLSALQFCKEVIEMCLEGEERKTYLDIVKVSLKNYPALINIIEFPLYI
jgi:hypothetical protein